MVGEDTTSPRDRRTKVQLFGHAVLLACDEGSNGVSGQRILLLPRVAIPTQKEVERSSTGRQGVGKGSGELVPSSARLDGHGCGSDTDGGEGDSRSCRGTGLRTDCENHRH